jgi:methyl-accepting chemotaxis protein
MDDMLKCWEFKKCGKEKTRDCVAVVENAGDLCWIMTGTSCNGESQGSFAQKVGTCKQCDYYLYARRKSGDRSAALSVPQPA